jgi:hypothetical protein
MADFILVSKRTLDELEYKIFRFHFLLGADWKLCCRRLSVDRGDFFHHVYRIQQKLGRTFRELQPYALFPLDEYFTSTMPNTGGESGDDLIFTEEEFEARAKALKAKFPVKRAA